jgi:hypothetical protein
VLFDPARISYHRLVEAFLASHPVGLDGGPRRVRTGVYAHDENQARTAREGYRRAGLTASPPVAPAGRFWPAERKHQKFHLQRLLPELVAELEEAAAGDFLSTTSAARLNAYLHGFASADQVRSVEHELALEPGTLLRRLDHASGGRR